MACHLSTLNMSNPADPAWIEAVLFDLGGVIVTSPFQAFADYERAHGLPEGFLRSLNASNPDQNAWALLERNEVSFEEFCELFEDEALASGTTISARDLMAMIRGDIQPEMVQAVRRCGERLRTALVTNNFITAGASNPDYRYWDLLSLFDVVIESSKVGVRKPDPRFYELSCERLGIHPSQAVLLDDLGINLKPARAMGMTTIKVTEPRTAIAELETVLGFALT